MCRWDITDENNMSTISEKEAAKLYEEAKKTYDDLKQGRINEEVKERKWGRS